MRRMAERPPLLWLAADFLKVSSALTSHLSISKLEGH